jgi:small subunit ribosomal protein S9
MADETDERSEEPGADAPEETTAQEEHTEAEEEHTSVQEPAPPAPVAEETPAPAEEPAAPVGELGDQPAPVAQETAGTSVASDGQQAEQAAAEEGEVEEGDEEDEEQAPRVKPEVPGLHLEVDIVPEGADPFGREEPVDPYATDPYATEEEHPEQPAEEEEQTRESPQPISTAAIDLAAGARYVATGKRKTSIARVILKPGAGSYLINGRDLDVYVPRATLQRNIRQPLETVGFHERMDVVARVQGGGISAQAGALRHGIARALIEADPNLRGELKRRGFLTRDARVKERKKAGLKKARKRPQFSKR